MGILDRMSRLVRANINDLLDRAEDPDKMIDQIIRDMQTNITDARRQVAAMIAQEKELEADLRESQELSNEWTEKAKRAVAAGKDDLAREALRRKRDSDENLAVYQQQHATQEQTVQKLKSQLAQLESKYQATLSQRDALVARQRRAEATKKVITQSSAAVSSLGEGLNATSELDRMEAKIRQTESEAAAYQELESESIDAQFRELDYDVDIESALEALKSGDSAPAGELAANSETPADGDSSASNSNA
jgi:phage shock protein A